MSDEIIYRCAVKASDRVSGMPGPGLEWLRARRGLLAITPDHAICGDWRIPLDDDTKAVLFFTETGLGRSGVLELSRDGKSWQFGYGPMADPAAHLPIPVEEIALVGRSKWIARIIRIGILFALAYLLVDLLR